MIINLSNTFVFDSNHIGAIEISRREGGSFEVRLDELLVPFVISEASRNLVVETLNKQENYHQVCGNILVNMDKVTALSYSEKSVSIYHANGLKRITAPTGGAERVKQMYDGVQKRFLAQQSSSSAKSSYNGAATPQRAVNAAAAQSPAEKTVSLEEAKKDINSMIGCDRAKRELEENLHSVLLDQLKQEMQINSEPMARHMAYLGNPGTGKTTFARKVAALYHAAGIIEENKVIEVTRNDLVGKYVGHTSDKTAEVIQKARGGILFIDEAYDLLRTKGDNDFGQEVINAIVPAMENLRDDLIVIFAGYPEEIEALLSSNPGLQSRCANMINFEDYTSGQLNEIMNQMLEKRGVCMSKEAETQAMEIIEKAKTGTLAKSFANAREVRNLVEQSEKALASRLVKEGKLPYVVGSAVDVKELLTIQPVDLANVSIGVAPKAQRNAIGYR